MIASIFITEHEYLIEKPQTLNFGGKYLYTFQPTGGSLLVFRKLNEKYIPDFFDISGSSCKVNLLTAIVGQNGVGKSSILDVVRSAFVKHFYSMPRSNRTILVEIDGETKILESAYDSVFFQVEVANNVDYVELEKIDKGLYQSIYYSPHFDLKYNSNFSDVDEYDISLDQFIKDDLDGIDQKGTTESGFKFDLHDELLFKNSMRQIEFINSMIFKDNIVFREVFGIPQYETGILHFRDVIIETFHNTPRQLQPIIRLILEKAESESKDWHIHRDKNKSLGRNEKQASVNKYLLERFMLKAFLSVVIRQMEKSNTWLEEGKIDDPYNMDRFEDNSAFDIFTYFIIESRIEHGDYKGYIFNSEEVLTFFEKLQRIFSNDQDPDSIKKQSIRLSLSELKEILKLHRNIVTNLLHYYPSRGGLIDKGDYIDGFLSVRPTDRNMSSGENALLNFFSKLYDFIEKKLTEESKSLPDRENYTVLLDEADLGFHPIWKKRYINAILKSLPLFFESLVVKPKIQIIITTHDPLTLSDFPINNVIFLNKDGDYCSVVSEKNKIQKTFGANITDLLSHSFFVEDGLIGDFAKIKIKEVISWINENKQLSNVRKDSARFKGELEYYKQVINLIDEKVVKTKLAEMITELVPDDEYYNKVIDQEIELLRNKRK